MSLDLAPIPNELKLLLEILKKETDDDVIWLNQSLNDIDWEYFLQLAMHHRIYPLVYSNLKELDKTWIPHHVINILSQKYKKNTYKMLQLCGEMDYISKLFAENKIRLLFLKGPVIADDLFGDISLRTSRDLDILIPINDLEKAEKVLLSSGYERIDSYSLNNWNWKHYHILYSHPQKQIQIEIHWRLHPRPTIEPSFQDLWERKRISNLTTHPIYLLGKEDLFLFLITHGARHGWSRLRWLIDIDKMIRDGIDLRKTTLLMKNFHYNHIGGQAFILASQLLNTPFNKDKQFLLNGGESRKLAQKAIYFIKDINEFNYPKGYMFSLKSNNQKILFIMNLFYPNYIDAETLILPKFLKFLHFPLRPFLWIWRKTRKAS